MKKQMFEVAKYREEAKDAEFGTTELKYVICL